MYSALVFTFGDIVFAASTQGVAFDHQAVRGTYIPGSHRTVTIRHKITIPRALYIQQTKTHPQLSVKYTYFIIQELQPWGGIKSATYRGILKECQLGASSLHVPPESPQLTGISHKEAYTLIWSPNFCGCCQRVPSDSLVLVASRVYACSPSGLHTLAFLKRYYLTIWFPISLNQKN